MAQYIIIGVVVCVSVVYAAFRIYRAFKAMGDPCQGCAGCALREQVERRKREMGHKRTRQKMPCYVKK